MRKQMSISNIIKRIFLTLLFPLIIFIVMYFIVRSQGVTYFGNTFDMWRTVLVNTSMTSVVALAIWLQLKNGRFDFSGGATMLLAATLAGNIVQGNNLGAGVYLLLCLLFAVILSLFSGAVYILGRLPVIICTIGIALLYESFTYLIYNGQGLNMMSNTKLTVFGRMPYILIIPGLALAVFIGYSYFTVSGRRAKLLAKNQQASVNIGIDEKKNVIQSFICYGLLLGLAAVMYGSQNSIAPQSGLSTASTLFSYIIPAYMGMFIGLASLDAVGVVMASFGMEILNYGMSAIGLGAGGWQQIIMGIFMLGFYALTAQFGNISRFMKYLQNRKNKNRAENAS